jgi:ribose transport system ATP-binding protein
MVGDVMTLGNFTSTKTALLEMKGIYKSFPGVQALQDVDFDLYTGEIHGLVGKNGAGKSTLMAVLMGIQEPDAGEIAIDGRRVKSMTPNEAIKAGVAYVPQRVKLMDSLTVAENILAGQMPRDRFGFLKWSVAYEEAERRLKELGLHLNVRSQVEGISVAEQTMLAIAKALFGDAKLIILDEPTAPLPRKDIDRLFSFIRSLKDRGVAFIYISHHMEEVFEICDRVTVMRDGSIVDVCDVSKLTMVELTKKIAGENVKEYERETALKDDEILVVKDLTRRGFYEDINLIVRKGEIIGISGLQGSGAETLGKGLFAMESWGIGDVYINNTPFTPQDPSQAFDQGLAYLPQDRYRFGLVGTRTVKENITYPILYRFLRALGFINEVAETEVVAEYIDGLGIVTPSQNQMARLLSGGNQQKVVFAKLAVTKPSVLILHEPTQGIDVRAKQDIYRIISELSTQGVSIVIISSEVRELIGVCDRIMVMYEGRITREFLKGDAMTTPENILLAIEGGDRNNDQK